MGSSRRWAKEAKEARAKERAAKARGKEKEKEKEEQIQATEDFLHPRHNTPSNDLRRKQVLPVLKTDSATTVGNGGILERTARKLIGVPPRDRSHSNRLSNKLNLQPGLQPSLQPHQRRAPRHWHV